MLNITLTKQGTGTVNFIQNDKGGLVTVILPQGIEFETDVDGANNLYTQYISKGFKNRPVAEPKVASPKKSQKSPTVKKTREESLTEKYGDKETRREYMNAKNAFTGFYRRKLSGKVAFNDFHAAVEQCVTTALKKWEEAGRPAYNC